MSEFVPSPPFLPHRESAYAEQRASCGCSWSAISGTKRMGERCERRLTGPRCEETEGCIRPRNHVGNCETKVIYG